MTTKKKIKNATAPTNARVAKQSAKAGPVKTAPMRKADGANKIAPAPRAGNKTDQILGLLKRPGGVTLNELAKATGWKPASVRGFLSGAIGKKMGTPVESFKSTEGDRSYRLSAE